MEIARTKQAKKMRLIVQTRDVDTIIGLPALKVNTRTVETKDRADRRQKISGQIRVQEKQ